MRLARGLLSDTPRGCHHKQPHFPIQYVPVQSGSVCLNQNQSVHPPINCLLKSICQLYQTLRGCKNPIRTSLSIRQSFYYSIFHLFSILLFITLFFILLLSIQCPTTHVLTISARKQPEPVCPICYNSSRQRSAVQNQNQSCLSVIAQLTIGNVNPQSFTT